MAPFFADPVSMFVSSVPFSDQIDRLGTTVASTDIDDANENPESGPNLLRRLPAQLPTPIEPAIPLPNLPGELAGGVVQPPD